MEYPEYSRIVFDRIERIEPDNVRKIIGCLLLHDHGDQELARLALAPDHFMHQVICRAKSELQQLAAALSLSSTPAPNPTPNPVALALLAAARASSRSIDHLHPPSSWNQHLTNKPNPDYVPLSFSDSLLELQNQTQLLSLEDHIEPPTTGINGFSTDAAILNNFGTRTSRHFSSGPEFQLKTCHYFNKGYCKHGTSCRYIHGSLIPESFAQMYNGNSINDDQVFSPGSLEILELEIVELLKSRRGTPISIASLPMIYYEKYGKVLQAEGYLTESQRHGKSGYSLTKLLARLKNSIRLIDRPHGQHAVILAEDAPKFMDNRVDKNDLGPIVSGSRQIYLTFPAESTFTEDDVSDYFNTFGMVEEVRIPCQQKRMFGFVTFGSADTVKTILSKGNPHFVCGARVLVKPYREKPKLFDRKYQERIEQQIYYSSHYADPDPELHSIARGYEATRMLRMEEQEQQQQVELEVELELERRRRILEMNFVQRPIAKQPQPQPQPQPYFSYPLDELKVAEGRCCDCFTGYSKITAFCSSCLKSVADHFSFPTTERFNYLLDVLNSGSTSDDSNNKPQQQPRNMNNSNSNYDNNINNDNNSLFYNSHGINLPDSPFASPTDSDISSPYNSS